MPIFHFNHSFIFWYLVIFFFLQQIVPPLLLEMLKAWIICDFICIPCWPYTFGEYSYSGSSILQILKSLTHYFQKVSKKIMFTEFKRKTKGKIPLLYWHCGILWKDALQQCLSDFNRHRNHPEILIKHRFWFNKSEVGCKILSF